MDGQNEKFDIPTFAKQIKQKYKEYQDVDDNELVERIVRKHPTYANQVNLPSDFRLLQTTTGYTKLDDLYEKVGREENVDPNLLLEQGRQETINFKPDVVYGRLDSPKGAKGLGQFMPGTAPTYGLKVGNGVDERTDPYKAAKAQAKYMRKLLDQFDGDENLALAGYNAGEHRESLKQGKIPNIKETQDYVEKISAKLKEARAKGLTLKVPSPTVQGTQTVQSPSVNPTDEERIRLEEIIKQSKNPQRIANAKTRLEQITKTQIPQPTVSTPQTIQTPTTETLPTRPRVVGEDGFNVDVSAQVNTPQQRQVVNQQPVTNRPQLRSNGVQSVPQTQQTPTQNVQPPQQIQGVTTSMRGSDASKKVIGQEFVTKKYNQKPTYEQVYRDSIQSIYGNNAFDAFSAWKQITGEDIITPTDAKTWEADIDANYNPQTKTYDRVGGYRFAKHQRIIDAYNNGGIEGLKAEAQKGNVEYTDARQQFLSTEKGLNLEQTQNASIRDENQAQEELRKQLYFAEIEKGDPTTLKGAVNKLLSPSTYLKGGMSAMEYEGLTEEGVKGVENEFNNLLQEYGSAQNALNARESIANQPYIGQFAQNTAQFAKGATVNNIAPLMKGTGLLTNAFNRYILRNDSEAKDSLGMVAGNALEKAGDKFFGKDNGGLDNLFSSNLGQVLGSFVITAMSGGASNVARATALGAMQGVAQVSTEAYETARRNGASEDQANLTALIASPAGLAEGLSDRLIAGKLKNFRLADGISKGFSKDLAQSIKTIGKNFIEGGATEFGEEFVQNLWGKESARIVYKENPALFKAILKDIDDSFKESAIAFVVGGVPTGGISTAEQIGSLQDSYQGRNQQPIGQDLIQNPTKPIEEMKPSIPKVGKTQNAPKNSDIQNTDTKEVAKTGEIEKPKVKVDEQINEKTQADIQQPQALLDEKQDVSAKVDTGTDAKVTPVKRLETVEKLTEKKVGFRLKPKVEVKEESTPETAKDNSQGKQPYEMTRAEWDNERDLARPNTAQSRPTKNDGSQAVSRFSKLESLGYGVNKEAQAQMRQYHADIKAGKTPKISDVEARDLIEQINEPITHRRVIEKALKEGKTVPQEVLADYPDLAKKYNSANSPNSQLTTGDPVTYKGESFTIKTVSPDKQRVRLSNGKQVLAKDVVKGGDVSKFLPESVTSMTNLRGSSDMRSRVSNVKYVPISQLKNENIEEIEFKLDGETYRSPLTGRLADVVLSDNSEANASIAVRALIDKTAKKVLKTDNNPTLKMSSPQVEGFDSESFNKELESIQLDKASQFFRKMDSLQSAQSGEKSSIRKDLENFPYYEQARRINQNIERIVDFLSNKKNTNSDLKVVC